MTVLGGGIIYAADFNEVYEASVNTPVCRLVAQSGQVIPDNTNTALLFGVGSEDVDSHGFHNTGSNTDRITPTVPGWYFVKMSLAPPARTDYTTILLTLAKNGSGVPTYRRAPFGGTSVNSVYSFENSAIMYANGTTDYFTALFLGDNVANASMTLSSGTTTSAVFECFKLRTPQA